MSRSREERTYYCEGADGIVFRRSRSEVEEEEKPAFFKFTIFNNGKFFGIDGTARAPMAELIERRMIGRRRDEGVDILFSLFHPRFIAGDPWNLTLMSIYQYHIDALDSFCWALWTYLSPDPTSQGQLEIEAVLADREGTVKGDLPSWTHKGVVLKSFKQVKKTDIVGKGPVTRFVTEYYAFLSVDLSINAEGEVAKCLLRDMDKEHRLANSSHRLFPFIASRLFFGVEPLYNMRPSPIDFTTFKELVALGMDFTPGEYVVELEYRSVL